MSNRAGKFLRQQAGPEGYSAFIPATLPPNPAIVIDGELARLQEAAAYAVGRLRGASERLDPDGLLYMYIRKEAVLSSQIEGTQSTLSDLLEYENTAVPGTPINDVEEVSRYVKALLYAVDEIQQGTLPLSLRLIREIHRKILSGGRGSRQTPGEFRTSQNWLGGTRPGNAVYVPPPPNEVMPGLDNLEKFLHDEFGQTPTLVKAGLIHSQFETIHPFLDGNGRVGRLLISLILVVEGLLPQPYFYISLYFKENRADYYEALQRVRTKGDWEGWLRFFLIAVESVAVEATKTAEALHDLFQVDRIKVESLGRAAPSAIKVYELLKQRILVSPTKAAHVLELTWPTTIAALKRMEELGITTEVTGKKRDRLFVYSNQLRILDEGLGASPTGGN
ncbi:MAG: Fic family protein [Bacteroidetes bacterium]|nr:Fic family protein [Bacteroidota bacterium]